MEIVVSPGAEEVAASPERLTDAPVAGSVEDSRAGGGAMPQSLEVLRTALADLALGLDSRFVAAGAALSQTYEIVERLIAALERVTGAMDADGAAAAVANMRATADRLIRLPETQAARATALRDVQQIGVALRGEISRVNRTLSFLRICGLNIKVASAGMAEFSDFADDMFVKLDVAEAEMARIGVEVEVLVDLVPSVFRVEQQLTAECAAVIPRVPASLAEDAGALQAHQTVLAARAAEIAEVARDVRSKLATALGALQIGDIARQRIEHVVTGLGMIHDAVDADPALDADGAAAVRGYGIAMLAAQAADTARDFQRETHVLMQNLHGIAPRAAALLTFRQSGDNSGDRGGDSGGGQSETTFLSGLERSVAEAESVTGRLREADAQSQRLGEATSAMAAQLAARLRNVHRVKDDVQHMAWNTDLRSYRMGEAGHGLAVVASEIRGFAIALEAMSGRIGALFERLASAAGAIGRPEGDGEVTQPLAESLDRIREGSMRMREGLAGLGDDATAISDMLRTTTDSVDCHAVGGTLADHATHLAGFGATGDDCPDAAKPALADLLDAIRSLYTMAREREIHRQFALRPDEATAAPAASDAEEDDDDDGLF
ncbi:hypothetical protein QP178_13795 [Sphingomonas aurantiaca]|uniref:hypothetical protein n=1 Tax=Sphingomonas TaxID=13687 RepID=UPI000A7ED5F5|nr:hypothetical protein [Sphingomonas sp. Leaf28]